MKTNRKVYILILSALLIISMMPFYVFADARTQLSDDSSTGTELTETDQTAPDDSNSSDELDAEQNDGSDESSEAEAAGDEEQVTDAEDADQPSEDIEEEPSVEETETSSDKGNTDSADETVPFKGKDGGVEVNVEAPKNAFPEGTTMKVVKVDDKKVIEAINDTLEGEAKTVKAVDITFLDTEGKEIQPKEPIKVTLKSSAVAEAESPVVVHVDKDDDGNLVGEKVEKIAADPEKKEVSFEAEKFSVYAVVDESTDDEGRATVEFYGKDTTTPIATVYVKNSDTAAELEQIIYDPGAGVLADGELFRGWNISTVNTDDGKEYTVNTEALTIEDIREFFARDDVVLTEGATTYKIYAMIFKAYSVQYKDEEGVTIHSETLINKSGETIEYTVNMPYTPKGQDSAFLGWNVTTGTDKIVPAPSAMEDMIYPNGTDVTISGHIIFSPNAPDGHWLSFNENGSGVSYTAPQFIKQGDKPTEPDNPTRNGYTFGGWYTDEACTDGNEFDFNQELTQRTTVYAKWTPAETAKVTVIVWKQSASDDYDAADSDKTYDFGFSTKIDANSNTPVSDLDLSQYTGLDGGSITVDGSTHRFYGFKYNTERGVVSNKTTVDPNGTTVVNLYYDREVVTYNFKVLEYKRVNGSPNWNSGNTYYVLQNGTYCQAFRYGNNVYYYQPISRNNMSIWDTYYVNSGSSWYSVEYDRWNGVWLVNVDGGYAYLPDGMQVYARQRVYNNPTYYTAEWTTRDSFTGLYGQRLTKYDYSWPTDLRWFNSPDGSTFTSVQDIFEQSVNVNPDEEFTSDFFGKAQSFDTAVYHYLQNEDGSWPNSPTYTIPTQTGNGMVFRTFQGFEANQFRIKLPNGVRNYQTGTSYNGNNLVNPVNHTTNDGWTDWLDYGTGVEYQGNTRHETFRWNATEGGIEFRYTRNEYPLTYMVGQFVNAQGEVQSAPISGTLKTITDISYESSLSSYAEGEENYFYPAEQDGYTFDGWYIDSTCTTPVDFANTTMPLNGITVYGKWVQTQYRVFMHPNVDSSDLSLDWGGQSMCFRVDYGEKIAGGNTIKGTRDDYELIGWYTDEDCTEPFNFDAYVLNDSTVTTPYDKTKSTELDKYGNPTENTNSDVDRTWINRELNLYAKWRSKLDGAKGINVVYDANDPDTVNGTNAPTDMLDYLDNSEAVAGAASTPVDSEYQFLHWVVQTWNGQEYVDTDRIVYPGDTFTVLKSDAKVEDISGSTDPDNNKTYTVQLRAAYGPKEAPTPTHITWYDNFTNNPVEGTNYITDNNLQINQAVDIEPANRFTRPGHKFLGWARVDTTDGEGNPLPGYKLEPRDLTESNVYLKYDEETGTFTAKGADGNIHTVSKVAADEKHPYHDMYAVWEPIKYTVVIRKHITGDYSNLAKEFTYTPSETLGGQQATFTLTDYGRSNIQKKFENIKYNTVVSVEEDQQDYTKTVTVKKYSDPEMTNQVGETATIEDGSDITVDNYVLIEYKNTLDVIITGVKDHGGMIALVAVGIAAIAGTFLMQRYSRRRRSTNVGDADK